jgi:hypothetical protein
MRKFLAFRQPFCFIGLHSRSYENMVRWCAYSEYYDRKVVLIDPSEGEYAKGVNFFRPIKGIDQATWVGSLVDAVMGSLGAARNANPVIFRMLTVLFTVMLEHTLTLDVAFELFANRSAFNAKVEALTDSTVKALWESLKKIPASSWETQTAPTLNRLFRIVRSETIRRFLCVNQQGYNLNLTFKDTILVNAGTSGRLDADAQRMFITLLINFFYQQAKLRKAKDGKDPSPYFLVVDEWVLAPTENYRRIAAECRKFGLLLILANQDLAQIEDYFSTGFARSLLSLCQIQICFGGINDVDASKLAREWGIPVERLKNLAERQFYAKIPQQAASLYTMPYMFQPHISQRTIRTFVRRIAKKRGALLLQEVDRLKASSQTDNESAPNTPLPQTSSEAKTLEGGFAAQWKTKRPK